MSEWGADVAGPVSPAEAKEALSRFNASHWHNSRPIPGKEVARFTIPADPKRDDDIRLGAFIEHAEALLAAAERVAGLLDMQAAGEVGVPLELHATIRELLEAAIANLIGPTKETQCESRI